MDIKERFEKWWSDLVHGDIPYPVDYYDRLEAAFMAGAAAMSDRESELQERIADMEVTNMSLVLATAEQVKAAYERGQEAMRGKATKVVDSIALLKLVEKWRWAAKLHNGTHPQQIGWDQCADELEAILTPKQPAPQAAEGERE